jgi:hypothetical protein
VKESLPPEAEMEAMVPSSLVQPPNVLRLLDHWEKSSIETFDVQTAAAIVPKVATSAILNIFILGIP